MTWLELTEIVLGDSLDVSSEEMLMDLAFQELKKTFYVELNREDNKILDVDLNQRSCDAIIDLWKERRLYAVTEESLSRLREVLGPPGYPWSPFPWEYLSLPVFPPEEKVRTFNKGIMGYGGFGFFIQVNRGSSGNCNKNRDYEIYEINREMLYRFLETSRAPGLSLGRFKTLEEAKKFCMIEFLRDQLGVSKGGAKK